MRFRRTRIGVGGKGGVCKRITVILKISNSRQIDAVVQQILAGYSYLFFSSTAVAGVAKGLHIILESLLVDIPKSFSPDDWNDA